MFGSSNLSSARTFLKIQKLAAQLQSKLDAKAVRVWRYVESQKVLFGCHAFPALPPTALAFEERVAFLRDESKLEECSRQIVVGLSDEHDGEVRRHPLWEVPEYEDLPKNLQDGYMESVLIADVLATPGKPALEDLIGVICIDAPYAKYANCPQQNKRAIDNLLIELRHQLRHLSLQLFREGFTAAEEYLRAPRETRAEQRATSSFEAEFKELLNALNLAPTDTVSIYLRSVGNDTSDMPLAGGCGDLYKSLCRVENILAHSSSAIAEELFSSAARNVLKDTKTMDAVLFPGSGGANQTYNRYKTLFERSRKALTTIPEGVPADDTLGGAVASIDKFSGDIIERGSFAVFPIRCMADTDLKGTLVGVVCVAVLNKRNFFTWHRRLVLERFCRMVGRRHDAHMALVLNRVSSKTHRELVGSPRTLGMLLTDPGPLVHRRENAAQRTCSAFVVSVDLRKSTDLMLKVMPEHTQNYARELMEMFERMKDAVTDQYGIFDRFTGDGVIAFFPAFFSGHPADAAYRVIKAADECHEIFRKSYEKLWEFLVAVPEPGSPDELVDGAVGLGIGIDYGHVRMVNIGEELTVVGDAAAYACRLSSAAPACVSLLNYRAYEAMKRVGALRFLECARHLSPLKHENARAVSYRVKLRPGEKWKSAAKWQLRNVSAIESAWRKVHDAQ